MTALPKRRISTHRQGKRRAAQKLIPPTLVKCSHCGKSIILHRACSYCGFYKGEKVIKNPPKGKPTGPKVKSKERKKANEKEV